MMYACISPTVVPPHSGAKRVIICVAIQGKKAPHRFQLKRRGKRKGDAFQTLQEKKKKKKLLRALCEVGRGRGALET